MTSRLHVRPETAGDGARADEHGGHYTWRRGVQPSTRLPVWWRWWGVQPVHIHPYRPRVAAHLQLMMMRPQGLVGGCRNRIATSGDQTVWLGCCHTYPSKTSLWKDNFLYNIVTGWSYVESSDQLHEQGFFRWLKCREILHVMNWRCRKALLKTDNGKCVADRTPGPQRMNGDCGVEVVEVFQNAMPPGGRLNKKDGLSRCGNSHVKDKTS